MLRRRSSLFSILSLPRSFFHIPLENFQQNFQKNGFRLIPESDRDTWFGRRHNIYDKISRIPACSHTLYGVDDLYKLHFDSQKSNICVYGWITCYLIQNLMFGINILIYNKISQ